MARKRRVWFPGAKYHITSRGIRKNALFHDDADRKHYLTLLAKTKERYPFILHSYCLMTNHIHLLLETIDTRTGLIMKHLHSNYAKYFNKRNDFTGYVFERRYGAEWIDSASYELDVSKYIHLNPLKAGIVTKLEDYPWSSYRAYMLKEENPLISTDQILSYFPKPQHKEYEKYLNAGFSDPEFDEHGKYIKKELERKQFTDWNEKTVYKMML
ncbi:transposase [Cytobacillus depressus]|uniref:Transposase n=1 Tax=Cytobacillus depressus TaxID=1602942 RepID=A0A6L3V696_9BACI|nr:transposase [Cytobacillus depressus]KAB2336766.1 transposase [Cytobacillus depressus]